MVFNPSFCQEAHLDQLSHPQEVGSWEERRRDVIFFAMLAHVLLKLNEGVGAPEMA
jgi:hypothetical protein